MIEHELRDAEARLAKRPRPEFGRAGNEAWHNHQPYAHTLLRSPSLGGRGNSPVRVQTLLGAQQRHGNRAVQRSTPMPQPKGLEDLVRTLGDRETGGPLGMLGSIVGDVATGAGGLMGTLGDAVGGLLDGNSGGSWVGAGAEGAATAAEDYGHNTASTAREAERSAATKPSEIPLSREELERTLYGR